MISLTLWDSLSLDGTISLNSVFHIKNVATRLFFNIKSLTATKSTTFELADYQGAFLDTDFTTFQATSDTTNAEGEIIKY